jgi:pyruvate carboxylase subunit B
MIETKPVQFNYTLRDSYQSNMSAHPSAREIIAAERNAGDVGWNSIQVGGGTFFDVPVLRGRDPWQEQKALCEAYPGVAKTILFRGDSTVGYNISPQDVVRAAIREYAKTGVNGFTIFDGLNDTRNQENAIAAVNECAREGMNVYAQGVICMGKSKAFTLDLALKKASELHKLGVRDFYLKDPVGIADPELVHKIVTALKTEFPKDVHVHAHNTHGMAYRIYMAAIEAGADAIDVAHPANGENMGQPNVLRMLDLINRHPNPSVRERAPNLNLDAIGQDIQSIAALRFRYSNVEPAFDREVLAALHEAKGPGGAASTLKGLAGPQFESRGISWKQGQIQIYTKQAEILEPLGDPLQVTPHAKNTTTQATLMVLNPKAAFTPEIVMYLTGQYGEIPGKPDPEWTARALKQAGMTEVYTGKPSDLLAPGLEPARQKLIDAGIHNPSDADVVTAAILNKNDQGLKHVVARENGTLTATPAPELPKFAKPLATEGRESHERGGVAFKSHHDVFEAIGGQGTVMAVALNVLEAEKKGHYKTPEISDQEAKDSGRMGPKDFRDTFRVWRGDSKERVAAYMDENRMMLREAGFEIGQQLIGGIEVANQIIRDVCAAKGVNPNFIPKASLEIKPRRGVAHSHDAQAVAHAPAPAPDDLEM